MSVPQRSLRYLLAEELSRSEAKLDLGRSSLLIAAEEYPQLSVDLYLARLDQVAEEVKDRLANETAPWAPLMSRTGRLHGVATSTLSGQA